MRLPRPDLGGLPLAAALAARRSVRDYADAPITLDQASQLLWAAQGITDRGGYRTAPSAGATFPLEVHLVAGNVESLAPGLYRYEPHGHRLHPVAEGDRRAEIGVIANDQGWIADGACVLVLAAVLGRTEGRYGRRALRYVRLEAGHAAQNVLLQAVALGLGAAVVGAFDDAGLGDALALGPDEAAEYMIAIGRPRP
jgi:SagB-type dehydrogenase family enzyme